jgi:hypothetical protein
MLAGCALGTRKHTMIDWADVLHVGGRDYVGKYGDRTISSADAGALVIRVRRKIADSGAGIHHKWADGDAAFLEPGTKVFEMRGYVRRFRLVALVGGEYRYYELFDDKTARSGRDMLDIDGRVVKVSRVSGVDGRTPLASTTDSSTIARIVRLLLDAPVRYPYQPPTVAGSDPQFFALGLADGTRVEATYAPEEGLVNHHIAVPPEFVVALASIGR